MLTFLVTQLIPLSSDKDVIEARKLIKLIEDRGFNDGRNLLEELILIFYCSEAKLRVDCMLNQRKRVRIEESQRTIFCVIPYDKAEMFQTATVIKDNISNIGP